MHAAAPGLVLALILTAPPAPPAPTVRERSPAAALALAVTQLTEEATTARREQALPRNRADFGAAFPHEIPVHLLARKLSRPLSRDRFVDAYVRWQLTSLATTRPTFDDATFGRMIDRLPAIEENPRADRSLLQELQRIRDAGELGEREKAAVSERLDRLEREARAAREFNEPARRLRRWLADQQSDRGARILRLDLEWLAAQVAAGWPAPRLKGQVEERFAASRNDPTFTEAERRAIAERAGRLMGRRRPYVLSAGLDDGVLRYQIDETAIYDFEVRRWVREMSRP